MAIFPDTAESVHNFVLLFTRLPGIKRRARLMQKSTRWFPSCRHFRPGEALFFLALACRWSQRAGVEVIRDNEPPFFAESVVPFRCAPVSRILHQSRAILPTFFPSRHISGLQSRSGPAITGQGRSLSGSLLVVSPALLLLRTGIFQIDMNKKPVAQAAFQHTLLDCGAVYGLLSPGNIAIVVCCFTLSTVSEVRYV